MPSKTVRGGREYPEPDSHMLLSLITGMHPEKRLLSRLSSVLHQQRGHRTQRPLSRGCAQPMTLSFVALSVDLGLKQLASEEALSVRRSSGQYKYPASFLSHAVTFYPTPLFCCGLLDISLSTPVGYWKWAPSPAQPTAFVLLGTCLGKSDRRELN